MDWVLWWFMFVLFTTCAGLGYFAGWQHGWAARKSVERGE